VNGDTGDVKIGGFALSSFMDKDGKEVASSQYSDPSVSTQVYPVVATRSTCGLSSCMDEGNKKVPSSDAGGSLGAVLFEGAVCHWHARVHGARAVLRALHHKGAAQTLRRIVALLLLHVRCALMELSPYRQRRVG
jgi:hypothetical protein